MADSVGKLSGQFYDTYILTMYVSLPWHRMHCGQSRQKMYRIQRSALAEGPGPNS